HDPVIVLPEPPPVRIALPTPPAPGPAAPAAQPHPTAGLQPHPAPTPAGSASTAPGTAEIRLPEQPAAPVVLTAADLVTGAIQTRLADPNGLWPRRFPKKDAEAIVAFYGRQGGKPLWIGAAGTWNPAAQGMIDRLARAGENGLDPADYPVPTFRPGQVPAGTAELAEADIKLSGVAALYARDARGGRIEPSRLSALLTPKLELPTADAVLAALAGSPDAGAALEGYNPSHPGYRALKAKLADVRANRPASQVPMARRDRGPVLTTQAIAVLNDGPAVKPASLLGNPRLEGDLVANMERWRWLPSDLGDRYVAVNVPEFRLRLFEGGRVAHETRVITGKPETPTPIFSGLMEYAVLNPSWYIPPSILKNEFLPKMAADPDYAAKLGYEVVRRGKVLSIRQPPGEKNALGFIKFMFPNGHAVYLHDTPNRRLFSSARRAFSHGCVRVDQPFALADFVLGAEWSEARLKKLIGRGERTIFLKQKLPVHLTYFTLAVDPSGEMQSFEDLYGHNRRMRAALGFGA
ncbi:MAG: ErfK/YbiS/YcfS/YnhG family protein, partial [Enterovirga sp.]|nr:ErfK/YbiS/YcfS/YnhG family protein [Enterovirga sp.]